MVTQLMRSVTFLCGPVAVVSGKQALPHALHDSNQHSNSWHFVLRFHPATSVRALTSAACMCAVTIWQMSRLCQVMQANHQQTQILPMQAALALASCEAASLHPSCHKLPPEVKLQSTASKAYERYCCNCITAAVNEAEPTLFLIGPSSSG